MFDTHIAKSEQARIIGQIQGMYSNASSLVKPTMNQVEFEKAVREERIDFYFDNVVKGYASEAMSKIEKEEDDVKKSEILTESFNQLSCLSPVDVVFDKMIKSIYVDLIDVESKTYKDNSINRKFSRVGKPVQ